MFKFIYFNSLLLIILFLDYKLLFNTTNIFRDICIHIEIIIFKSGRTIWLFSSKTIAYYYFFKKDMLMSEYIIKQWLWLHRQYCKLFTLNYI